MNGGSVSDSNAKDTSKNKTNSRWSEIAAVSALLISAINGYIAYIGWSSEKDILEIAKAAKEKQEGIKKILEGGYFLYTRAVEREITDLVAELPGIELSGEKNKEIKATIKTVKENLASLESHIQPDARLSTRYLIDGSSL